MDYRYQTWWKLFLWIIKTSQLEHYSLEITEVLKQVYLFIIGSNLCGNTRIKNHQIWINFFQDYFSQDKKKKNKQIELRLQKNVVMYVIIKCPWWWRQSVRLQNLEAYILRLDSWECNVVSYMFRYVIKAIPFFLMFIPRIFIKSCFDNYITL